MKDDRFWWFTNKAPHINSDGAILFGNIGDSAPAQIQFDKSYQNGQPFGVALIKSGQDVGGRAEPFMVGCTAIITEMEPLPGGRMNIVAVGRDRFVAHSLKYDQPYLVAEVENLEAHHCNSDSLCVCIYLLVGL